MSLNSSSHHFHHKFQGNSILIVISIGIIPFYLRGWTCSFVIYLRSLEDVLLLEMILFELFKRDTSQDVVL